MMMCSARRCDDGVNTFYCMWCRIPSNETMVKYLLYNIMNNTLAMILLTFIIIIIIIIIVEKNN